MEKVFRKNALCNFYYSTSNPNSDMSSVCGKLPFQPKMRSSMAFFCSAKGIGENSSNLARKF